MLFNEKSPIILTGNQRSGTTFLSTLLSRSPNSSFGIEDGLIRQAVIWFYWHRKNSAVLPYARFNEFIDMLNFREGGRYLHIKKAVDKIMRDWLASGQLDYKSSPYSAEELIRRICFSFYEADFQGGSPVFWGDKYPEYCFMLSEIAAIFPDSKFIFLVRHPYGNAEALARKITDVQRIFGKAMLDVEDCVIQCKTWNSLWQDFRESIDESRRLEIRYEDMINNTGEIVERISEFTCTDLINTPEFRHFTANKRPEKLNEYRKSEYFPLIAQMCRKHNVLESYKQFGYSYE